MNKFIESWNFQHLFDLGFHETLQNFSPFRQPSDGIFSVGNKSWAEILWGFMYSKIKQMLKISAFYLGKQKSVIPKKNVKSTMYHG